MRYGVVTRQSEGLPAPAEIVPVAARRKLAEAASVCACFNFRKASRAVTQLYDTALAPTGLRSTQFVMLLAVYLQPGSIGGLARLLVMDRTTLNRNLRPLLREGLVASSAPASSSARGRRPLAIALTDTGRQALMRGLPLWEKAQRGFVKRVGSQRWPRVLEMLTAATAAGGARD